MYGTVMIAKMKGDRDEAVQAVEDWHAQRQVPGYLRSDVLFADDGETIVVAVQFDSKENYVALADDPEQDQWWRTVMSPMLDGEPTWIDGHWSSVVGD
jgi:antibiotic biosynthesis monooxygenase (ABM) superfamily enzyme